MAVLDRSNVLVGTTDCCNSLRCNYTLSCLARITANYIIRGFGVRASGNTRTRLAKPMNVKRRVGLPFHSKTSQTAMHFREKPRGTVGASLRKIIPALKVVFYLRLCPSPIRFPVAQCETSFQHDSMPRSCKCESTLLRALKVVLLEGLPLDRGPGPFTEKRIDE